MQHIVCLYHFIELPVRHLFEELDGNNNFGPIGKDGPLGTAVKDLNDNLTPLVAFETVSTNVEILDIKIFNGRHEHIIFYELCHGVATGNIDKKYETMEGPNISSCRWRTYFIRLLEDTLGLNQEFVKRRQQ